jgi:hypothetical protein
MLRQGKPCGRSCTPDSRFRPARYLWPLCKRP